MNTRFARTLAAVGALVGLTVSAHAEAPAGRYTTANGTVYDTKTKLTWQQAVPSTTYSWANAKSYCSGLSLAGTGWRLPTVKELQTIKDESIYEPSIDPRAFPSMASSSGFWTSSPLAGSPSSAWVVYFSALFGCGGSKDVSSLNLVRCVR